MSIEKTIFLPEVSLKGQCRLTFVINIFNARPHYFNQSFAHLVAANVHSHAVRLNDSSLSIAVNDKPWQVVALTMDQTVGVILRIICNTDGLAHA